MRFLTTLPEISPFETVFQPDIIHIFLAQTMPSASLFTTDMKVHQPLSGTYSDLGDFTAAFPAFAPFNQ
jgi:hypothetical protein